MTPTTALIFLPFTVIIGLWVSYKDLSTLKIPNKAVLTLLAVWLVVGPFVMPWQDWLWGWGFAAIGIVVGFVANLFLGLGAGDAKFGAAMAPFFVQADLGFALYLISCTMIGSLICHKVAKHVPLIRTATPDWKSWNVPRYVPFGLALTGILNFYLIAEAVK